VATGDLTIAGQTRPISVSVPGRLEIVQSEWGIKPYRGLMGALKVRDEVEVILSGL